MDNSSFSQDPSSTAQFCSAGVDLSGLMQVLSKHLYSTPMVALRELVQNSHDSIVRRRIEHHGQPDCGRIQVIGDVKNGLIRIIDNGAGLTEGEIHAYLATVGVGYTRTLRQQDSETGLIGMFGLGFLSAFVLAKQVIVTTTSYQQPEQGWRYLSSNGEKYSTEPVPARENGTEVTLLLRDEFSHLASEKVLNDILRRYCILLREPIFVGQAPEPINPDLPPWRREANVAVHPIQDRRQRLEFAAHFEENFEPICTVPVISDAKSDAVGMLWVQDGSTYGTSDNRNLSIFLRGMLLDDDARDLLPPWAGFIGGVIESNKLTPTASREDLQRDSHYFAVQYALSESLIHGLAEIALRQPEVWRRIIVRHNETLLGAALCDERLFDLLIDTIKVPTSQGDLRAQDLRSKGAIHVILDAKEGFEETLFQALGVPVAYGDRYAVVPFLRRWAVAKGCQLVELGTNAGNKQLFRLEELPANESEWLLSVLGDGEKLIASRFDPAELPLVVVHDREAELKKRLEDDESDKRISVAALHLARQFTAKIAVTNTRQLYINLNNPAVNALLEGFRQHHAGLDAAARMLKALKVIMSSRGSQTQAMALNRALSDFSQLIPQMLARPVDVFPGHDESK
ncbi:ATP-binding protein [Budvicia diplopodorum]|uniref:ATP-binding protein n=1 Tax=Budvicia diplopodorum TaxID=1119056 RepID=UPI00135A4EB9|nr:ATP-binding protein [Budvicia diplopodorum]